jgi:ParB family chromosome partitioning protein
MLSEGALSFGHGKVLAALIGNPARQIAIARKIVSEGLSVRETEQLVVKAQQPEKEQDEPRREAVKRPSYVIDAEDRLCQAVGTRVRILPGRAKNSGRIVVDYYTIDDFDRISSALGMSPE